MAKLDLIHTLDFSCYLKMATLQGWLGPMITEYFINLHVQY